MTDPGRYIGQSWLIFLCQLIKKSHQFTVLISEKSYRTILQVGRRFSKILPPKQEKTVFLMLTQKADADHCLYCGACCAFFRVSFYWVEGEAIPEDFQEQLTPVYSCMKGTNQKQPRCIALQGEIGQQVQCSIYSVRSSSCREVQIGDQQCAKARSAYGLIPVIQITEPDNEEYYDFDRVG